MKIYQCKRKWRLKLFQTRTKFDFVEMFCHILRLPASGGLYFKMNGNQ